MYDHIIKCLKISFDSQVIHSFIDSASVLLIESGQSIYGSLVLNRRSRLIVNLINLLKLIAFLLSKGRVFPLSINGDEGRIHLANCLIYLVLRH